MDDIESGVRNGEGREWGDRVSLYLGTLTLYIRRLVSIGDIGIDTRPHKPGSDELLCRSDSWV